MLYINTILFFYIFVLIMKQFLKKSISICLVFVVLFSTMSFTIDMHYCGGTMVDFSFFNNVETCEMEKEEVTANCQNSTLSEKSCCSEEQFVQQGQDNLKETFSHITFEHQAFVAALIHSYIHLFEETITHEVSLVQYLAPFVTRDVQVLHQTFLI